MARSLPLNALNAFEVADRHGSFSKAAEELNVTPASVKAQDNALSLEQLAMDDLSKARLVVPFHHEVELATRP